jgi:hypothetical protein
LYDTNSQIVAGSVSDDGRVVSTQGKTNVAQTLPSAVNEDDPTALGEARSQKFLLVLSGVPSSITEGTTLQYTNVGSITVEIVNSTP